MVRALHSWADALLLMPLLNMRQALADCECGYRVTLNDSSSYILTDLIETNFANISDVNDNTDWVRQEFNKTAEQARGTYGQMFAVDNVETESGDGLDITVKGEAKTTDDMVQGGEIDTARLDLWYGTYRSSMRLTDVAGTVSAFFWYLNDTQEIDMEFLSKEFQTSNASYPVHLVLQSRASSAAGYDASNTSTYQTVNLPFDPRGGFHEYRFDFFAGRVLFLADGDVLAEMDDADAVPTAAGHLALNHWSNGNAQWSGGPPATDANMTIRYVKAYFNSSDEARRRDFEGRCADAAAAGAVCDIPEVTSGNDSAAAWFFSGQKNMTANQTVSDDSGVSGGDENAAARGAFTGARTWTQWAVGGLSFAAAAWVLGL